jgi:GT2 family glycosyltransferase
VSTTTVALLASGWVLGWALAGRRRLLPAAPADLIPEVSVIVPARNEATRLPRLLEALSAAPGPVEVLVVDDGSTDGTAAVARAAGATVLSVEPPPGWSGKAHACWAGAEAARGDVLVFVDADVEVHPNAFRRIRAAFRDDFQLDAVYGSYDDSPSAPSVVSTFRNLLHHHVHHAAAGPAETFWAGIGAVRRSVFFDVGGFDADRYPHPSVEDIDLGRRLHAAGARIVLDPTIQGTHLKSWTLRSMVWTDFARRAIPWVALIDSAPSRAFAASSRSHSAGGSSQSARSARCCS